MAVQSMPTNQPLAPTERAMLSNAAWQALSSLVSIVVSSAFWYLGAGWTLAFVLWMLNGRNGLGWFVVPVLFSIIETAEWKIGDKLPPNVRKMASGMKWLDMATTSVGLFLLMTNGTDSYFVKIAVFLNNIGRTDFAMWFLAPTAGIYLIAAVVAFVSGYLITVRPERTATEAVLQLWEVGKLTRLILFGKGVKP